MANKPSHRHRTRRYVLQAHYQWLIAKAPLSDIEAQFRAEHDFAKIDEDHFQALFYGIPQTIDQLDGLLTPLMHKAVDELDPIELCVLRMATYELQHCLDVPYKVVIDEALNLNKQFGTVEGFKFVNAVLDQVSRQLRPLERPA